MHIIVLGAGVTGLTTAYCLASDGHRVTVVDSARGPGLSASFANGGQLSYSYVAPLAGPSALRDLPGWLVRRDAPLRFQLQPDPRQWLWCLRFLAACTGAQSRTGTERLLRLAMYSRDKLDALQEIAPLAFDHSRTGKLVVYSSVASLDAAQRQMEFQRQFGCEQSVLDAEACLEVEPALAAIRYRLVGGIFTPSDQAGDCRLFCAALEKRLREAAKVSFLYGRRVERLMAADNRVLGVETDTGVLEADTYVLALGSGSPALAASVGIRLPIYPLKGYSLTVPIQNPQAAPRISVTDSARKVVYARLGERLRIAGMADLVGWDDAIDPSRLSLLVREARHAFPAISDYLQIEPWSGLRPATPTGLPILGPTPLSNLLLNVGQGALGFTLAMGSAQIIADLAARRPPALPLDGMSLPGNANPRL
ncbi:MULTISPECIES: D-amino acid dehydrogenase [unclassified Bradyrhizobium]|uniref:D-amino acid dehydrogenase n=1 Tax=unclassified Bradyrhizobium TaxID=2631580 RepID=UPI00291636E0|nr:MULTISPECIES: D-amino acid dehydrogenase [unclassified Bradyrhizobium]